MATLSPALTPGVSAQTLALAFNELAALQRAGVRLDDSLEQAAGAGPLHFRQALEGLAAYVRAGHPLAEGMRSYGALFHPVIPAIVGAGEQTGNLDTSFALLSQFFESEAQLRRVIQSASIYPVTVAVVAILIVFLLNIIKIPIGDHMESILPVTWAIVLLWILAFVAAIWFLLRFRSMQQVARYVMMAVPFFGGIMHELAVSRFCQTFGLFIRAGIPYLEGLQISMGVAQHPAVEQAVRYVYASVRNGIPIEEAIRSQSAFPKMVRSLVGAGEVAGTLDESFLKAAQFLRQEAEQKIRNSSKMAGPVMTIIIGIIVGLIVIQFWGHIWQAEMSIGDDS